MLEKQLYSTFLQAFISQMRELSNLDGQDITGKSIIDINKAGIARTFQNIRLFKDMTVLDNVKAGLHNHYKYSTLTGILQTSEVF